MKVKQLNMALVGIVLSFTSAATADSIKHEPVISDLPASPTFALVL